MKISLVLVAYRSSVVAGDAIASFRSQAMELGAEGEVVVVDHSEDAAEQRRLAALGPQRLMVRPNRGYAAGINAGVAAAAGEVLLLANPDLELAPGALAALVAALDDGWEVVGPQFSLGAFSFPPAEEQTPSAELRRRWAVSSPVRWRRFMLREERRCRRVWAASQPVPVPMLSGALLAVTAATAARLGPWPEDYFLYFEEVEWLLAARRRGMRLAVVPAARARHAWGHSADPAAQAARFTVSRRRYFGRCFGLSGRLVARLDPPPAPLVPLALPPAPELPRGDDLVWLLSPSPRGFPAAALAASGSRDASARISASIAEFDRRRDHHGPLYLTALRPAPDGGPGGRSENGSVEGYWVWTR